MAHDPLARKIALAYSRKYHLEYEDALSEARSGLVRATETFDPDRGWRFSTYAMHWSRAAVQDFVRRSSSMLSLPQGHSVKKVLGSVSKLKALDAFSPDSEGEKKGAAMLGIEPQRLREILFAMSMKTVTIDGASHVGDEDNIGLHEKLADDSEPIDDVFAKKEEMDIRLGWLKTGVDSLSQRDREIFEARFLKEEPEPLFLLGEKYGVSKERIRQLESRAIEKVTKTVRNLAGLESNKDDSMSAARISRKTN
jgi:RNA polymerase sigma-32 factor